MSNRISKQPRTSTQRRKDVISRIEAIGIQLLDMGRCTPCQQSGSLCFVLKGYSKCSSCTKKGIRSCDGNFSTEEFDAIESQKERLRQEAQLKRQEVGRLASAAAAAYAALAKAQQEEVDLSSKIDRYTETQSRMLRQELRALDDLDEAEGQQVAVNDFPWEDFGDPSWEAVLRGDPSVPVGGTGPAST
ncbi:leucine-rich repeats of kinetochore protein cenp-F/LEK1 domain-containing protein [Pochonia chlamydosporia 170]|uniref:Leucine-rich repeats of kinetochore protein cenp-F/LEK1 domain-containing protein n=1 Tax=Pochonia chlamydosporia 170 TaxID=1380566 RepID=A0A179EYB2_METCM|nr:leucine-rich repeats of kinetochore protein cenp-F/LEK1 domain-containing protein [Pochonia chlamydosporia 170]OAQ58187.1 leucine-rich repeats of kinetochore protein cenp-F/LEK1 domain-containing protein [Pochonia chlamydosporia 170]